ncbi:MAG: hypothetical protein KKD44_23610 [Proteobacteria bacterium]|nr:hypothetical protein [Pseudomonadota bacterium]
MKPWLIYLGVAVFFIPACSVHYYKINDDSISFYLKDKDAKDVHFQYSYDGFECHEAQKIKGDTWKIIVPSVNEFSYFYMVDGKVYVPPCLFTEHDDFGNENCIFSEGM